MFQTCRTEARPNSNPNLFPPPSLSRVCWIPAEPNPNPNRGSTVRGFPCSKLVVQRHDRTRTRPSPAHLSLSPRCGIAAEPEPELGSDRGGFAKGYRGALVKTPISKRHMVIYLGDGKLLSYTDLLFSKFMWLRISGTPRYSHFRLSNTDWK